MTVSLSTAKMRPGHTGNVAPLEAGRVSWSGFISGILSASKTTGTYRIYLGTAVHPMTIRSAHWISTDDSVASSTIQLYKLVGATATALSDTVDVASDTVPTSLQPITLTVTTLAVGGTAYVDIVTGGSETLANLYVTMELDLDLNTTV